MEIDRTKAISFLKEKTRSIPDFPARGIVFRDLSTIFQDPGSMNLAVELMGGFLLENPMKMVGIEARGFILAGALAGRYGGGVVLARKPGKLPYRSKKVEYELEYGKDALEMHEDALLKGEKVIIVDDLLATGGTAKAASQLVEAIGGEVVKLIFMVELPDLNGRNKLSGYVVETLFSFSGK